jgi:PGF-CTERM protein
VNIVSPSLESPDVPGRFDRGDVIPIELELEGGNVATITFGDAGEQNVEITATVYDPTFSAGQGDTTVNLFLSTYHIGHGYVANGSVDDLELNTPQDWNTPGVADNRNHGFIVSPEDPTSALLPAERLDREHNVFAEGSIDIYGGSQGGAVLSPDPGYDLHATGGDLPYTLIGDDRDDERDDVNFLTVDERSTQEFRFWTAPGEGDAAINIGPGTTAGDIENLVSQGLISELETETVTETGANGTEFERIRFNGQVAEGDFLIVQAQATGLEGPLIEAELRQNPSAANVQDLIETVTGTADDGVITNAFLNATSEMVPDSELGDEPNNRLLDYRFDLIENGTSYQQRIAEPEPNEELLVPNRIDPDLSVSSVVANLNADDTPSEFYVPYKVGVDLPVPTGANTDTESLTFDSSAILEPRGGTQPSVPTSVNPLLTADSIGVQSVDELGYVPAQVSIDSQHTGPSGLEVSRVDNYTITGTSTMASGTTVDIVLLSETDEATPFLKTVEGVELTAQDDSPLSAWEATFDFSETRDNVEIVGGTVFEADITRAGAGNVAGGEDIPGLVLNDPAIETFTLNNQRSDGDVVTIAAYEANRVSQITIQDADGNVLGTSDVLPRGQPQEQFNIGLDQAINSNQQVTAVAEIIKPEAGAELASETAEVLVEEQEEAFFGVSDLSPTNGQVEQGATVTAEATVENLGDLEGTQSVEFSVVGTDISVSEEVTLAGGESTTVSFDLPTGDVPPNSYTHQIASEDDTVTGGLTVQAPPEPAAFEIVSLSPADASVTQGDELVVDVSVQNTGGQEATQDVVLSVSGLGDVGTQSLTLAGGDAGSVSFTVDTTEVEAGDYTHSVSVGDASAEGSLTIMEPAPADDSTDNGTNNGSSDDGSGPGFGIVVAALALLGAALLAMRRQVE